MGSEKLLQREWIKLQNTIVRCKQCPRFTSYLKEVEARRPRRFLDWSYWSKPLPGFGDPNARVLIIGLAPSAHGGNRTGRMFTGDRSGAWLFQALHHFGFANQSHSDRRDDNLKLKDCYITATVRCAPPQNKPVLEEIEACRPYLLREFDLLRHVEIIVPLGRVAYQQTLTCLRIRGFRFPPLPFGHGKVYSIPLEGSGMSSPFTHPITLVVTYHPSQQNTLTGKLSRAMFYQIFETVCNKLGKRSTGFASSPQEGRPNPLP